MIIIIILVILVILWFVRMFIVMSLDTYRIAEKDNNKFYIESLSIFIPFYYDCLEKEGYQGLHVIEGVSAKSFNTLEEARDYLSSLRYKYKKPKTIKIHGQKNIN